MRLVTQIASLSLAAPTYAALCPLLGPVFPPPRSLSSSASFEAALNGLRSTLDEAFAGGNGPLNSNDTYSVQVFSTFDKGKPLFDFHRRGAGLSEDLDLNGDAIFRLASTSKLITTYLLLLQTGDGIWTEKVTRFLPELSGKQYWDQISVGALAGYISGITSEVYDNSMLPGGDIGQAFPYAFPPLSKNESRGCRYETGSCTREIFLDSILAREPNFLPNTTPAYSNAAFGVLGLIVESITGKSFAQSLRTLLLEPLSLTGTSTSPPNASTRSVILNDDAPFFWWKSDLSDAPTAASGGMFSSPNDMSTIGRAILSSSLLPANTTRAWLQPTSFTSSLTGAVGRGWEIYRHVLSADANHIVDIFSKAGVWGSYGSNLFLLPAYNVGVTILQAGARGSTGSISNLIATHLLPALEDAARQEADEAFAGTYTIPHQNSSLTLTTTPGLAGLTIASWIRNGTDITVLPLFADPTAAAPVRFQMYPTNAHGSYARGLNGTQSWRIKYTDWVGEGPFDACASWATVDRPTYGLVGVDEFVFSLEGGRARGVRPAAWKEEFGRVD